MTDEQIEQAAFEYIGADADKNTAFGDFIIGAKWALSHQWISVKEKFPEKLEGEIVSDYVYVTNGNWYDIMRYEFNEKIWLDYTNGRHWGITYWMSIPKLNKD